MAESRSWALGCLLIALMLCAPGVMAAEDSDAAGGNTWHEMPEWVDHIGVTGRYVGTPGGSESKYLEDHNIQSGPVISLGIRDKVLDEGVLSVEGMVEPVQDQGYLLFDLDLPGAFSVHSDIQAWREFYNTRTGDADETVNGTELRAFFPNSNNSTHFFGGGKPRVDWLRTRSGFAVEMPGPFNDLRADFLYRRVRGEMSLLKGGSVFEPPSVPFDPADVIPTVAGSGPGTVFFDISGRKQIDYESIGGVASVRARFSGLNVQIDGHGMRHKLKSTVYEPNFQTTAANSELERFGRDTTIDTAGGDIVVSRSLRHNLFVFGGASFSWDRSEPEPTQIVQTGIRSVAPTSVLTRETLNSEVERFSGALSGGTVFQPIPTVVVRATAAFRGSSVDGDLTERRDESGFIGDIGTVVNSSERNTTSIRARVNADWRAAKRLKVSGFAQYDFRYEEAESRRVLNFVAIEAPEIEDYTNERSKFKIGGEARYRFRRGRTLEGGYEFSYVGFESDVDELSNQFILADYERTRHRIHMKAAGRITKKLHGEVRAQYVFESRTLDEPNVDPPDFAVGAEGEIEIQSFMITPMLAYQHDEHWSAVLSASLSRTEYKLVDDGPSPAGFSSRFQGFDYEALTGTLSASMNWSPTEKVRNVLSYTLYSNDESVQNIGHDASIRTSYALDENWDVNGSLRYLGFDPDDDTNNVVDDYHTVIVSAGVTGRF